MSQVIEEKNPFAAPPLSIKELTELLVKHHKFSEGHYEAVVEFAIGTGPAGPSEGPIYPSAIIGVAKIGVVRREEPTSQSVDAASLGSRGTSRSKKVAPAVKP